MQNPVLPQVSSQLYSNGYVDNVSDHPMQMGSRLMNGNDSNYYLDPSMYSTKDELAIDGVFAICSQVPINYHSELHQPSFGAATQLAAKSNIQNSYIDNKNLMHLSQLESITGRINNQYDIRNTRKRPIENASDFQQRSPEDIVDNKSSETGWPPNKKMSLSFQGQSQDHYNHYNRSDMKEIQRDKVPARKSQKLADRITALQKLVSPYGKTDTASVLQEASLFIKALLDQIENMLVKANPSPGNENSHQVSEDKQCKLQDKGLCLVPVSMTQKLVKEDTILYPYSSTMINSPISPEDLSTFM